jgi:zinc transporter 5/7
MDPPEMEMRQLLLVSSIGLGINLFGMWATGGHHHHGHSHGHDHGHGHSHAHVHSKKVSFVSHSFDRGSPADMAQEDHMHDHGAGHAEYSHGGHACTDAGAHGHSTGVRHFASHWMAPIADKLEYV